MGMSRFILVVDSLRYDYAKYLYIKQEHWCNQERSFADGTRPAFIEIGKRIKSWQGQKIIYTAGHTQQLEWQGVELRSPSLYPFMDCQNEIIKELFRPEDDKLLIVHDFYVHQYWIDVCPDNKPNKWHKDKPDIEALKNAYRMRVKDIGVTINNFLKYIPHGWNIYITADHAECFWEDGESFGHGPGAKGSELVYTIPLIGIADTPILKYHEIFE